MKSNNQSDWRQKLRATGHYLRTNKLFFGNDFSNGALVSSRSY